MIRFPLIRIKKLYLLDKDRFIFFNILKDEGRQRFRRGVTGNCSSIFDYNSSNFDPKIINDFWECKKIK